ncbi:MAG TPA: cobalt ECF transporter T component CbiQ [Gammaproteobacteria bacterium]|nr:cobalt ECF transporter T component CbiQ [Gammaproteobacteria bacterium]
MPLDIDRYAHLDTPLRRWDPRYKLAAASVLIVAMAVVHSLPVAVLALGSALVLVRLAGLPFHFVRHGVSWVLLFLLPFFLILPFSYPGAAGTQVLGLGFAWEGVRLAALIVTKALAIVLTAYAVFGSSRFDVSMIALQRLKCPPVLVQIVLFTYRYIFVFLAEMKRMDTAMRARGFVKRTDGRTLSVLGHFVGTLLVRSFERTERIYKAMLSKGYDGRFRTLVEFHADGTDKAKAIVVGGLGLVLLATDLSGAFSVATAGWY